MESHSKNCRLDTHFLENLKAYITSYYLKKITGVRGMVFLTVFLKNTGIISTGKK
jgi:hypothetical protein